VIGSGLSGTSVERTFGATQARVGKSEVVAGWNVSVANLDWIGDHVLVDLDAAPADSAAPYAKTDDFRFGLYAR